MMRSIRLSLLVYLVLLLALGVGTASVLLYRTAEESLSAKKASTEELLRAQYREECRREETRVNEALLFQAQTLARLTQFQCDWTRLHHKRLHALGLLSSSMAPSGYVLGPLWILQSVRGHLSFEMSRSDMAMIKLDENDLFQHLDGQVAEYYQIDTAWGSTYLSSTMRNTRFPGNPRAFAVGEALAWDIQSITLHNGAPVRRVILKTPATRLIPFVFNDYRSRGSPFTERARGSRENRAYRPPPRPPLQALPPAFTPPPFPQQGKARPAIFIQCACDTQVYGQLLAGYRQQLDEQLAEVDRDANLALTRLRNRLILMTALIFGGVVSGTILIVQLGLAPLRRLSQAVGRISPRDFTLPVDPSRMPREVRPIVDQLTNTLGLLERAFQREKQATADISHELRTPVAALMTTIEIALRKERTPQDYREMLQDCRGITQQMSLIIERLLKLAQLDAGADRVRPERVEVGTLLEQCVSVVRPLAEAQGLSLRLEAAEAIEVHTDVAKLREIVNNLLHNAIQYNRLHGRIDLRAGRNNGHVEVRVEDTGVGINGEVRPYIFERFYRADKARTGDGLHAGLGLAIVKEYLDLMGGKIEVESVEGEGTTFCVALPAPADQGRP